MSFYKIVLNEDGVLKTLYKGIEGSRTLRFNEWMKATKKWSTDGSGQKPYLTGIHVFKDKKIAKDYLNNFRTERPRVVVECEAKGLRQKPSNENVYLADEIYIEKMYKL